MNITKDKISSWLGSILDRVILSVEFLAFVPTNNESSAELWEIRITVDGDGPAHIKKASDGESISLSTSDLQEFDMEPYGVVRSRTEFDDVDGKSLVGQDVRSTTMFVSRSAVVGFEITLSNGRNAKILNVGDVLTVLIDKDHPMLHEEDVDRVPAADGWK